MPMGSFQDWDWIRGALVWLDCADPARTRATVLDNDPVKDDLVTVMSVWNDALGDAAVDVGEIARRATDAAAAQGTGRPAAVVALRDKLVEVTGGDGWNGKRVGWWLRRHKDPDRGWPRIPMRGPQRPAAMAARLASLFSYTLPAFRRFAAFHSPRGIHNEVLDPDGVRRKRTNRKSRRSTSWGSRSRNCSKVNVVDTPTRPRKAGTRQTSR